MKRDAPVCWAVIPVKAPGKGKSRLAGVLGADERSRLITSMLERVVDAAHHSTVIARVCLVGLSDHGLGEVVTLLGDIGDGLNEALSAALVPLASTAAAGIGTPLSRSRLSREEEQDGSLPDRLVIIAGDLPRVDPRDFAMLAEVPAGSIGIAPDRHGTGTNALSIPLPAVAAFRFAFGRDSYVAHRREIVRLGYAVETLVSEGLEKDIDEPADLTDAASCLDQAQ